VQCGETTNLGTLENVGDFYRLRRFGLTVRFVEGRLRLAKLASVVFEALAPGEITLDLAKPRIVCKCLGLLARRL